MYLERLARTYWRFLTRVTLGLVRVRYSQTERSLVLLGPRLRAAHVRGARVRAGARPRDRALAHRARPARRPPRPRRRGAPADRGAPPARRGSRTARAAARRGRGRELPPRDRLGLRPPLYNATQSRIHVLITHGFLRSLARLDLAESRVGRFADGGRETPARGACRAGPSAASSQPPTRAAPPASRGRAWP